ncbi:MAG: hypothetical protein WBM17_10495, partial [Anaerolineales bacterium]
ACPGYVYVCPARQFIGARFIGRVSLFCGVFTVPLKHRETKLPQKAQRAQKNSQSKSLCFLCALWQKHH